MKLIEWWKGLDGTQRIILLAGLGVIVVLTAAFAWFTLRTNYVPLLDADAGAADQQALVARLDAVGADYHVDADSKRIMVPDDRRDRLRAALSIGGAEYRQPKGFEVFDNSDFGMTEFSQRINYERGLEGELARTIMGLDNVRYARIHLVLPDASLFQQEREEPKASVTLMTAQDKGLSSQQIEGIRELVAFAVPSLRPEMVSIHDYRGVDLAPVSGPKDALASAVDSRIKAKEQIEDYLTAKVYDVLGPVFPAGSVAVSVDVSLSMDKVSSTRDQTTPKLIDSAVRERMVHREPAGADKDAATAPPPPPAPTANDYGIDKLHQQVDQLPGAVERISVGVVIPQLPASAPQHLSPAEVQQLIGGAIGINPQRGDVVSVAVGDVASQSIPASTPPAGVSRAGIAAAPAVGQAPSDPRRLLVPAGIAGVLLLIGGWLLGRRSYAPAQRLTAAERELLFSKMKQWLQQNPENLGERR